MIYVRKGYNDMSMIDWAKHEVELACKGDPNDDGVLYAQACFQSALKAFESICNDDLTGFMVSCVRDILVRLLNGKPLTPIEDVPESWHDCLFADPKLKQDLQCVRMSSLFKQVHHDGTVRYRDVNRVVCTDQVSSTTWHNGLADRIVDEMFPITFPYCPESKPYKVRMNDYLTDRKNGDFDTVMYIDVTSPDGTVTPINRYFGETEDGWKELTSDEFTARYARHLERVRKEKEQEEKTDGV